MKLNLSPGGLSIGATSPVFLDLLVDETKDTWEKYEVTLMENSVTNLLFGKNIKFDHWGTMSIKSETTGVDMQVKVHKSEGLLQQAANKGKIEGVLYDTEKVPRFRIKGHWTGNV